jgi:glycerophosphoryl diester phosphodiesterase
MENGADKGGHPGGDQRTPAWRYAADAIVRAGGGLRRRFGTFVAYDIAYSVLMFAVLGPLSTAVLAAFIAVTGRCSVTNTDIIAFVLSVPGIVGLFITGSLALCGLFVEQAGLMIIAASWLEDVRMPAHRILWRAFCRLPALFLLAVRMLAVYALVGLPVLALAGLVYWLLWSRFDMNYLVTIRPPVFWIGAALGALLLAGYAYVAVQLYLRWVFALPICVFRGESPSSAIRSSRRLARGWKLRALVLTVVAIVSPAIVTGVLIALVQGLGDAVLTGFDWSLTGLLVVAAAVVTLDLGVVAVMSFVGSVAYGMAALLLYRDACKGGDVAWVAEPHPLETESSGPPPVWFRSRSAVVWATLAVAAVSLVICIGVLSAVEIEDYVEITAHRGDSSRAPENTLAAVRSAIEAGADYAEIDVQLTADDAVVLAHDDDCKRIAGDRRRVRDMTLEEVRTVDAGSWFGPAFAGEPVPTLEEVIALAGDRIRLNIELKVGDDHLELAERVLDIVARTDFESRCIITSLSSDALREIRRMRPDARIGLIVAKAIGDPAKSDVDLLSVQTRLVTDSLMASARNRERPVHVWTVNDPDVMVRLLDLGVTNVITDYPLALRERLREVQQLSDGERFLLMWHNWITK